MKLERTKNNRLNTTKLSLESLESRIVLDADPMLTVVADQGVDEGSTLTIENIGTFTDVVEGDGTGGTAIGLDPAAFMSTSLGAFDSDDYASITSIVIDTGINGIPGSIPTLTVEYGASQTETFSGGTTTANTGDDDYDIAVFTFDSFNLSDFNPGAATALNPAEILATGGRPVALLSLGDTTIAGTIDASARTGGDQDYNAEQLAGPGGGNGGLGNTTPNTYFSGDAAAGAPASSVGSPVFNPSPGAGTGGGFGGDGGQAGDSNGTPAGVVGAAFSNLAVGIQGGSGGATGGSQLFFNGTTANIFGGGGGGGGLEIGAVGDITITGELLANGGDSKDGSFFSGQTAGSGGAGAGGGILIHADSVTQNGDLQANGGNAPGSRIGGGGGGGGEILIVASSLADITVGGTHSIAGGAGVSATGGEDGMDGLYQTIADPSSSTPIIETFDYVIDWGDGSTSDTGAATIDMAGTNIDDLVAGSFDGSHTYSDDGDYTVTVTVTGSEGGSDTKTFLANVANVAPTLTLAGLSSSDEGASYSLDLTSSDPGDDTITQWDIDWGDGNVETFAGDPSSASHTYADGNNSYLISATATDEDGTFAAGNTVAIDVANLAPVVVSLTTDSGSIGGAQQGEAVNLSASFTDAGLLDTHTATIDWGDGTTSAGLVDQGTGTVTADHAYAAGGYYDVTLTLVDNDSDQDIAMTATVIAGVGVQNGVLNLVGSDGNDKFKVFKSWHSDDLHVLSRLDGGSYSWQAVDGPIDEINMQLGDGDDVGFVSRRIHTDAVIDSGTGDDLLVGGGGNDILLAGAGYDTLFGGGGRDLMIGGTESDLIFGDGGSDILISGTTAFDNDRASLDAVMAEWTSSRSYSERVDNITGDLDLSMDGLNGEIFLIADETVFDDEAIDWLIGGRGKDLYFAGDDDFSFARFNEVIEEIEAEGTV